jgi:heme transport system substrate-binding protein
MTKILFLLTACLLSFSSLANAAERVVSVGGALTEMIYALDADKALVGSDTTSYYPAAAAKLPKVGYQRALSTEGILSLRPDLVIVTDDAGPPAVLLQLKSTGVRLEVLKAAKSVDDIHRNLRDLGDLLDRTQQAHTLIENLKSSKTALEKVQKRAAGSPKVLFIMTHSTKTPMAAGVTTSADAMISLAGGHNVINDFEGYRPLTAEAAVKLAPDVILTTKRAIGQVGGMDQFLGLPGLQLTPAGKNRRVIAMDGLILLGFGPRTIEGATDLHQQLSIVK